MRKKSTDIGFTFTATDSIQLRFLDNQKEVYKAFCKARKVRYTNEGYRIYREAWLAGHEAGQEAGKAAENERIRSALDGETYDEDWDD